ncbi:hypothetical protein GI374_13120 [Paracoccus sp. S-4012]|uniref:hypothetical protein n=1 Tax=Paracoccus sp. S-4012 TaxID=2665648 RepID=UPI0012B156BA|nr:hypothetical protein [Paracoccus sp. S-4012]MRX51365.1 hypothetical protein [Paracoccus sp. S-4012]
MNSRLNCRLVICRLRFLGHDLIFVSTKPAAGQLAEFEADLTRHLAGRAAERLIFGDISSRSGGPASSDLAEATRLALHIDARLGLGSEGPIWRGRDLDAYLDDDPENAARVRARLMEAEQRAMVILEQNRNLLVAMAETLNERGILEELEAWLGKVAPEG